jgi:hypothetical protein
VRRLGAIVGVLCAGAILNVSVAWACAIWSDPESPGPTREPSDASIRVWRESRIPAFPDAPERESLACAFGERYFILEADRDGMPDFMIMRSVVGWPWGALERRRVVHFTPGGAQVTSHFALTIPASTGLSASPLPLKPVWPGFAANTLLFAAGLWLNVAGARTLRRRRRLGRGLCPVCAYPRGGGTVCTECGEALPPLGRVVNG